jgi:hypothetical protein
VSENLAKSTHVLRALNAALERRSLPPLWLVEKHQDWDAFFPRKTKAAASRRTPRRLLPQERHTATARWNLGFDLIFDYDYDYGHEIR